MSRIAWVLAGALLVACNPSFQPPDVPAHDDERGGAMHAALSETPLRCPTDTPGPPTTGRDGREAPNVSCVATATRPPDRLLSCDTIGCHGGYDHRTDPITTARHLRGSNGPSCYTCHGEEWRSDR